HRGRNRLFDGLQVCSVRGDVTYRSDGCSSSTELLHEHVTGGEDSIQLRPAELVVHIPESVHTGDVAAGQGQSRVQARPPSGQAYTAAVSSLALKDDRGSGEQSSSVSRSSHTSGKVGEDDVHLVRPDVGRATVFDSLRNLRRGGCL